MKYSGFEAEIKEEINGGVKDMFLYTKLNKNSGWGARQLPGDLEGLKILQAVIEKKIKELEG